MGDRVTGRREGEIVGILVLGEIVGEDVIMIGSTGESVGDPEGGAVGESVGDPEGDAVGDKY